MINLYRKVIEIGGVSEGLNSQNTLDQEQISIGYEKKDYQTYQFRKSNYPN